MNSASDPHLRSRGQALVASTAIVVGEVAFGARCSVWYGAVVRGDCAPITVGAWTNIQDLAVVHADTGVPVTIGERVTVGHHAVVHGRSVGDGCLIGIGAVVLGGAEIGAGCIVAAGAVVRENARVPPRTLVAGVPSRPVREVSEQELAGFLEHAEYYWSLARKHLPDDT